MMSVGNCIEPAGATMSQPWTTPAVLERAPMSTLPESNRINTNPPPDTP